MRGRGGRLCLWASGIGTRGSDRSAGVHILREGLGAVGVLRDARTYGVERAVRVRIALEQSARVRTAQGGAGLGWLRNTPVVTTSHPEGLGAVGVLRGTRTRGSERAVKVGTAQRGIATLG